MIAIKVRRSLERKLRAKKKKKMNFDCEDKSGWKINRVIKNLGDNNINTINNINTNTNSIITNAF